MKIGITGATGQLGRLVVEKLKQKTSAENLVALIRSPQKAAELEIEARQADYNKPDTLVKALSGIDHLLLISGNEIGKRLEQHTSIVEAAKAAGVKWIVYTSLLHADTSTLGLAPEHLGTEALLQKSGIPFTLLRNGWYTENYSDAVLGGITSGTIAGSAGEGKIASATRNDFAEAAAVVLTTTGHIGKTYELAGDEVFTLSDLAKEVSGQTGQNISYMNMDLTEYAQILVKAGLPEGIAQFLAGTHIATEKGDLFDDSHQLSGLIGRPTTPLTTFISQLLETNSIKK